MDQVQPRHLLAGFTLQDGPKCGPALLEASGRSFCLNGSAYDAPDFDDVATFVERLVRANLLTRDQLVTAMLERHPTHVPERTVRHRFSLATGLSQTHLRQVERASEAAALLRQGVTISDVVYLAGYADQPTSLERSKGG